ncbi:MB2, putative [Brugia malayi]|uniref:MB2, putative n=2 Tax=Brugia malayi TaxID=6279 RepID=A0A4E9F2C6_BRUMA|nr:MB2, putative [Brugia malayi]VIO90197.1 MB2, putative [Brugia malayi]
MQQHNFYRLKLGLPGTTKSEVLQGKYAKLILPAASNDYLDAVVTHVESWTTVHIQLANAYHILSKLQKELKKIYHTTKSLSNPLSGSAGIMKYGLQNECYRVLIIKRVDPTLIFVRFVDFGYTDVATKQLIHPIPKNLTAIPAQAFPIRMELKQGIAGSVSFNAFRKYLTNAQVIIQLGNKTVNDSFMGVIHVIDESNRWHWMNEAIESKIPIKKLVINANDNEGEEMMAYISDDFNNQPMRMIIKPSGKIDSIENENNPKMIDQHKNNDNQINDNDWKNDQNEQLQLIDDNNSDRKIIVDNLGNKIVIDKSDKETNGAERKYDKQGKNYRSSAQLSGNNQNHQDKQVNAVKLRPLDEAQKREKNRKKLSKNEENENYENLDSFISRNYQELNNITNKNFDKLQQTTPYQINLKKGSYVIPDGNIEDNPDIMMNILQCQQIPINHPIATKNSVLEGSTETSQTTTSNSWKNAGREKNLTTLDNKLKTEDLGSVIGLMAYGSLKDDIDNNLKRRYNNSAFRQYAGRSITDFNLPLSSTSTDYTTNTQERSQIIVRNQDNKMNNNNNSFSEELIDIYSAKFTSESTDNDQLELSASIDDTTLTDIVNRKQNMRSRNHRCKNNRKNGTFIEKEMSTDDDESSSDVSPSNSMSSTKTTDTSTEATAKYNSTKIIQNEIANHSDNQLITSLPKRTTHTSKWIRSDMIQNDSYVNTQQNSNFERSKLQQPDSVPESNSISRTSPVRHTLSSSSSSFTQTNRSLSNENIEENKYQYANSVHSSDFEIPSYLNTIPKSSYSQQFTYETSQEWICPQQINDIKKWSPLLIQERTNSTQTHTNSKLTQHFRILPENVKTHTNSNNSIYSESTQTNRILPIYQLENIPKRFSSETNAVKYMSKSFHQIDETAKISSIHQSQKYPCIHSIPSETTSASDASRTYCMDFQTSLPYKSTENEQISKSEQCIESYPRTNVQFIHSELSSEIAQTEESSLMEGLKMKIVLIPRHYQLSHNDTTEDEECYSDQKIDQYESISSFNSSATSITYESIHDLATFKS